ncbi:unnamed protein product [Spirodela intermedia]|uniref:Uncharacterized protein n=1 Tax=Spirodela intermedia TaxID=51605 RepID=A0A7I8IXB6_SPIIN|nr:unnamed protein product [Spirodela intermedia]CAA6661811.1 unnamed protein product [Spirodela intermedia]
MSFRRAISVYHMLHSPASRVAAERSIKPGLLPPIVWKKLGDCSPLNPFFSAKKQSLSAALFQIQRMRSSKTGGPGGGKISIGPDGGGGIRARLPGPISSTIKKVKLLSLSTCCLSVSLGPVITFMTSPEMNVILKGAVASTVIFLSASTTAALHWFVSPYVHKLRWRPGADSFDVEMLSWLATPLPRTVRFADVRPPQTQRPFVTFKAGGDFYFVDGEHFRDKALLARLTPQKTPFQSALKNL